MLFLLQWEPASLREPPVQSLCSQWIAESARLGTLGPLRFVFNRLDDKPESGSIGRPPARAHKIRDVSAGRQGGRGVESELSPLPF